MLKTPTFLKKLESCYTFYMKELLNRHLIFWKDKTIRRHLIISSICLAISLYIFYFAIGYTDGYTNNIVPDILLDHLPIINISFIFFQGAFFFFLALVGILLYEPKYIPFVLEGSAVFCVIRAMFMSMTHLSAPVVEYYNYIQHEHHVKEVLFTLSSGNDLFFSGHAGYPFFLALIFWQFKKVRCFFLFCSAIGSVAVILGHLHYSIDVFSAFFIAFGIFEITKKLFKKEYELLNTK